MEYYATVTDLGTATTSVKLAWCPSCKRNMSPSLFNKNKHTLSGLQSRCRSCQSAHRTTDAYRAQINQRRAAQRQGVYERKRVSVRKGMTGKRFGKLVAIAYCIDSNVGQWVCKCDCGKTVKVKMGALSNTRISKRTGETKANTTSCGCNKRSHVTESAYRSVYFGYRANARRRNIGFFLSFEQAKALFTSHCHYCGSIPAQIKRVSKTGIEVRYNGIDRMDSDKNYEIGNVVPCCWPCNSMKRATPYLAFVDRCQQIAEQTAEKKTQTNLTVGTKE